jgi:parallel beta-helix repeat protein
LRTKTKLPFIGILGSAILLVCLLHYGINNSLPGNQTEGFTLDQISAFPYSYLVEQYNSTHYQIVNGTTGAVDLRSTNASYVINIAMVKGSLIFLKAGTYQITSPTYPRNNTFLWGEGEASILKATSAFQMMKIGPTPGFGTPLTSNVTIENIHIIGPGTRTYGSSNDGIRVNHAQNCLIQNCLIERTDGCGVEIAYNSSYIKVFDNYLFNIGYIGITTSSSRYTIVRGNTINGTLDNAIDLNGETGPSFGNIVEGNTVTMIGNNGVGFDHVDNSTIQDNVANNTGMVASGEAVGTSGVNDIIAGNTLLNSRGYGIYLGNYSNTASNNLIVNCTTTAIFVQYSDNTVRGNTVKKAVQYGISVSGDRADISDNKIEDVTTYDGINFANCNNGTIQDNVISFAARNGITLGAVNNTIVQGNTISFTKEDGIYLYAGVKRALVQNNHIINAGTRGISLSYSSSNKIYHNDFLNGTYQASVYQAPGNLWDDGYPSGGNYWSHYTGVDLFRGPYQNETGSDGIGDTPYIIGSNNTDNYPLMKPYGGPYDIGITNLNTSKTIIGQGYNVSITVTVLNYGNSTEIFNVTAYVNTAEIGIKETTLTTRNSTTVKFTWNTKGIAKGNYTISAHAWPVPGETDTSDNTLKAPAQIEITIPGDVDGNHVVNIFDVVKITSIYASKQGDPKFNPNCDIDGDRKITMLDVVACTRHYGQTWTTNP